MPDIYACCLCCRFHYPAKRSHTWEERPRVRIDAALLKIQPFIRGYWGRVKAWHQRRRRALEVVKNAFRQARLNKTARQILDRQRSGVCGGRGKYVTLL